MSKLKEKMERFGNKEQMQGIHETAEHDVMAELQDIVKRLEDVVHKLPAKTIYEGCVRIIAVNAHAILNEIAKHGRDTRYIDQAYIASKANSILQELRIMTLYKK
jgi:hypothetical protein